MIRRTFLTLPAALYAGQAFAQQGVRSEGAAAPNASDSEIEYICPMDKDERSKTPRQCTKCGMQMVANLPEAIEYRVRITMVPAVPKPGQKTELTFHIADPKTGKPVTSFEIVHEKLYHLFVVSQDLGFFVHTHPERQPDSSFKLAVTFPKAGLFRILSDFYPTGGTPQLVANTVMVPGSGFQMVPAQLQPDVGPQHSTGEVDHQPVAGNLDVNLQLEPPQPIVGEKTMMFFHVKPNQEIEQYLGAWAHMMTASSDLIDMIHSHPFQVSDPLDSDYKLIHFNTIFPRPGIYRVWIQVQRKGVVNTIAFNIPVTELK